MIIVISITLFFLILRFSVTVFNFVSNPKLTRVNRSHNDLISILIPARNEEDSIVTLLTSVRIQDYQNYEVIVYDDDSSDNTYTLCNEFAKANPRFRVIKGSDLPDGWLGKNHACAQLAAQAKGKYLLFMDADTTVAKYAINSAIHRLQLNNLALLSLFPNQVTPTIGEKVTVPLLNFLLLNLLPLRLIFLVKNAAISTACGQFMLFDAGIYQKNGWHNLVKDEIVEDAAIMRQVKSRSYNGEVLLANGMVSCRMYKDYSDAINGFSKNALAAFNYSVAGLLIYIMIIIGGPMIIMMTLNFNLILYTLGLIILSRVMIALSSGQKAWYNIILHPVQMANLAIIAFLSVQRHLTKTIIWKGRRISN